MSLQLNNVYWTVKYLTKEVPKEYEHTLQGSTHIKQKKSYVRKEI